MLACPIAGANQECVMSSQPIADTGRGGAPAPSPRAVDADRGLAWWSEAWRLFTPAAGVWVLIIILLFILNIVLAVIPLVGHVSGQLLFPIFAGGPDAGLPSRRSRRATDRRASVRRVQHAHRAAIHRRPDLYGDRDRDRAGRVRAVVRVLRRSDRLPTFGTCRTCRRWRIHGPRSRCWAAWGSRYWLVCLSSCCCICRW